MVPPVSYLLCGTPRTRSTLLCDLLASTGVAGRPESYFREPDQPAWAERFGLQLVGDGAFDHRSYVHAVRRAGSTPNGVFAARVMWGSMHRIVEKLDTGLGARSDLDLLGSAFGGLCLVHVKRADVVRQAVSWARAEQTDYWQEGDKSSAHPRIDVDHADRLVRTITEHNAAWSRWFTLQGVEPYVVTYEDVVADPRHAVQGLLDEGLGVAKPNPGAFLAACRRLDLSPGHVLHIGDLYDLDVVAAREAGLQALYLDRTDEGPHDESERIITLDQLGPYLQGG